MRFANSTRRLRKGHDFRAQAVLFVAVLAAGCVSGPLRPRTAEAMERRGTFEPAWSKDQAKADPALDPAIPAPESIVGHPIGDGAVRYEPMVRYLRALAEASRFVQLTPYAESHEGRTLFYLTITSEANHARLNEIMADNAKLADPRKLAGPPEAERILETLPAVAWLAYAIHGDELSSTDAALMVAYHLAAGTDETTRRLRDDLVIHIDPLMNPDGRERYLGQLQHLTGKVPNPDFQAMQHWGLWSAGRGNHYLFDLNRDWLMQVHPETQGRAARIRQWNPHLVVDSHEMGSLDTYLFDPPREPFNTSLSESNLKWRRRFSADQAKAFDAYGWSYYTQEWYEEWYPGYTNAWTSLLGAIGLLYEQAGVNAAAIKQPAGQVLTYRESVHHHVVSSLANLESLRANRREILSDFLADRRWAISAEESGREVFLLPPIADRPLFDRFVELLGRHGIEAGIAAEPVRAKGVKDTWGEWSEAREFPAGTLVVRAAQPHRRLLMAALEFDPHMSETFLKEERKEIENHRGTKVYDVTAWNLPMAFGLPGYWAEGTAEVRTETPARRRADFPAVQPQYGYLIDGASSDVHAAVARLLEDGFKPRVGIKPFRIGGHDYQPGSVLLRRHENADTLSARLRDLTADLHVAIRGVDGALSESGPDLGGQQFELLTAPRIAVATQWPVSSTSFGSTWYLLDARLGLRISPLSLQAISRIDLRKYNVIVLPDCWFSQALESGLDEGARKKLKSWIEAGGTLIALGNSAAFVAGKDRDLSGVRMRRDVLDQLAIYEEALQREKQARDVVIDPGKVWGGVPAPPASEPADSEEKREKTNRERKAPPDVEALKRQDEWERLFRPQGAIVSAAFDPEHWLAFGLATRDTGAFRLPVVLFGQHALLSKHPVQTPVRLEEEHRIRLSGLLWPETRRRWANAAYATVERVGYGQIILFTSDPFFRGYLEGSGRLFLNALIFGPGLGTSQPVPW